MSALNFSRMMDMLLVGFPTFLVWQLVNPVVQHVIAPVSAEAQVLCWSVAFFAPVYFFLSMLEVLE